MKSDGTLQNSKEFKKENQDLTNIYRNANPENRSILTSLKIGTLKNIEFFDFNSLSLDICPYLIKKNKYVNAKREDISILEESKINFKESKKYLSDQIKKQEFLENIENQTNIQISKDNYSSSKFCALSFFVSDFKNKIDPKEN